MRTTESARYARWAAGVAIVMAVIVVGVYLRRALRQSEARREGPPPVPAAVQQQSAGFSFSKVDKDHTLFTVRASHATEFKGQDKSVLEDVWLTVYGREGKRYDNLHTRECSFQPSLGRMRCQGDVQMDLESAEEARTNQDERVIHLATKDVSFDRGSGVAATEQPVQIRFLYGEGHAVGATYNSQEGKIRLERDVEMTLAQKSKSAIPVVITGSSLEYLREERILHLFGPTRVRQGERELTAANLTMVLDTDMHARSATASGKPEIRAKEPNGQYDVTAEQIEAFFHPQGWVERVVSDGGVRGWRTGAAGRDDFQAQWVEVEMEPRLNAPRQFTATGDVKVNSQGQAESRRIETASIEVQLAPGANASQRHVRSAKTPGPAVIETKSSGENMQVHGGRFDAQFTPQGTVEQLFGHSGVEIHRQVGAGEPQVTTAQELAMTFGSGGKWATAEETGKVRYHQADRTAEAEQARIVRATDTISLAGAPVVADKLSSTAAGEMQFDQRTGEVHATGGVRTSYFSAEHSVTNLAPLPAHITAASLDGNQTSGHVVYSGGARLWQGDSLIEAQTIELWQPEQRMEARDKVNALVTEAPDARHPGGAPVPWHVRAARMQYWSAEGRAKLEGGVTAESERGSMQSRTLELFLAPGVPGLPGTTGTRGGQRQLNHAVALGNVVVGQADRRGSAERGEYFAADGKFVLSGGNPTLTDAAHDTTTGVQLTFFTASDTILVSSESGSRTLTKHRVEK